MTAAIPQLTAETQAAIGELQELQFSSSQLATAIAIIQSTSPIGAALAGIDSLVG